ncbi:MAG: hypothetical protein RL544_2079, partial [Bacteroidota bacterium]
MIDPGTIYALDIVKSVNTQTI